MSTLKINIATLSLMSVFFACKTASVASLRDGNIAKMDENGQMLRMVYGEESGKAVAYICSNQVSAAFISLESCKDRQTFPGTSPIPMEQYRKNLIKHVGVERTEQELNTELEQVKATLAELVKQQVDEHVTAADLPTGGAPTDSFQALIADLEIKRSTLETEIQLRGKAQTFVDKVMGSFDKSKKETIFVTGRFLAEHQYVLAAWSESSNLPPLTRGVESQISNLEDGTYRLKRGYGDFRCGAVIEKVDTNIVAVRSSHECAEYGYFECKDRTCKFIRGSGEWSSVVMTFDSKGRVFLSKGGQSDSAELTYSSTVILAEKGPSDGSLFRWGKRIQDLENSACGMTLDPVRDRNGNLIRVKLTIQNNGSCPSDLTSSDAKIPDLICNSSKFMCQSSSMQILFHGTDGVNLRTYRLSNGRVHIVNRVFAID